MCIYVKTFLPNFIPIRFVIASQYATSNCKLLLVGGGKWQYINVETFNLRLF